MALHIESAEYGNGWYVYNGWDFICFRRNWDDAWKVCDWLEETNRIEREGFDPSLQHQEVDW